MRESGPVRVFISYSHADDLLRKRLQRHLVALENQNLIEIWSDRQIDAGSEWEPSIRKNLEAAEIILLLVSPDFLASDFCQQRELKRAIDRHAAGQARVIPIFLRPCDWKGAVFGRLQGVPEDARPVTNFGDRDKAFATIAEAIRKAATDLRLPRRDWVREGREREAASKPATPTPNSSDGVRGAAPGSAPDVGLGQTFGMGDSASCPEWKAPPAPTASHLKSSLSLAWLNEFMQHITGVLATRAKTFSARILPIRSRRGIWIASAAILFALLIGLYSLTGTRSHIAEREPNDIFSSATEMSIDQSASGKLFDKKDVDFYKIHVPDGFVGSVDILLNNISGSEGFAPLMTIYSDSFEQIKEVSSPNRGAYLAFVLQVKKGVRTFYISIANYRYTPGVGTDSGAYELSVLQHR